MLKKDQNKIKSQHGLERPKNAYQNLKLKHLKNLIFIEWLLVILRI